MTPSTRSPHTRRLTVTAAALIAAAIFTASAARDGWTAGESPPPEWRPKIKEPATPPGSWRTARDARVPSEQQPELERLESLGYFAGGAAAPPRSSVTVHDATRAWDGLNLCVSGDLPGARLIDMDGDIVHEWRYPFLKAWPDRQEEYETERGARYWFNAHLFENGDIIGIFNGLGLVKLDKDSNLIWKYTGGSHHDVCVAGDGTIYVITHARRLEPRISGGTDIYEDAVTVLDADGNELDRVSLLEAFWDSDYASWLRAPVINRGRRVIDVFHANRLLPLDGRRAGAIPSFAKGNFLLSLRNMNALAVLDMEAKEIVWTMSGMWLQQHCPSLLDDGDILLFDNQGNYGSSRVIEFDPATQEIVWSYEGDKGNDFYSEKFGTAQRLPNGNTLIAESHFGRALEVTRNGETVWEYINPARAGDNGEFIANLFEVERLPRDFPTDWLE